ncbi:MAG: hypothetical protein CL454_00845 [Acidimicrobiaceae bacterium]|nr:hypothetical protein [Acidimicrobiaceae bacterium]
MQKVKKKTTPPFFFLRLILLGGVGSVGPTPNVLANAQRPLFFRQRDVWSPEQIFPATSPAFVVGKHAPMYERGELAVYCVATFEIQLFVLRFSAQLLWEFVQDHVPQKMGERRFGGWRRSRVQPRAEAQGLWAVCNVFHLCSGIDQFLQHFLESGSGSVVVGFGHCSANLVQRALLDVFRG